MQDNLCAITDEKTILITAVFLESGDILKTGDSGVQKYELDLFVPTDITCDQLLGAIFGGLRDTLTSRYHLDLSQQITELAYRAERGDEFWRKNPGRHTLRERITESIRLREFTSKNSRQARKIAAMDRKYRTEQNAKPHSPQKREQMGWIVCWQVFQECFHCYSTGYPKDEVKLPAKRERHGVIARSSAGHSGKNQKSADRKLVWLSKDYHGEQSLGQLGFVWGTQLIFDPMLMHSTSYTDSEKELLELRKGKKIKEKTTQTVAVSEEDIRITPPPVPPARDGKDIIPMVLSPLITTGAVISAWAVSGGDIRPENMLWLSATMVASAAVVSLLNRVIQNKVRKAEIVGGFGEYERYIRQTLDAIQKRQQQKIEDMRQRHPPVWTKAGEACLLRRLTDQKASFFGCKKSDADFLWGRLGVSGPNSKLVSSPFAVIGEKPSGEFHGYRYINIENTSDEPFSILSNTKNVGEDGGYLRDLPEDIARKYAYLTAAPVGLQLQENKAVGFILEDKNVEFTPILDNFLMDLCANHSPEDLQVVWFFREREEWQERDRCAAIYKQLPHGRLLFSDRSQFVFSRADALDMMDRLMAYGRQEKKRFACSGNPHILALVEHGYESWDHPIWNELERLKNITFLFCGRNSGEIPVRCNRVIRNTVNGYWQILPGFERYGSIAETESRFGFVPDPFYDPKEKTLFQAVFRILGSQFRKHAARSRPSGRGDFLHLLSDCAADRGEPPLQLHEDYGGAAAYVDALRSDLVEMVNKSWFEEYRSRDYRQALPIPLGWEGSDVCFLDLHDNFEGPHMLIRGPKNSGKTKTMTAYLLELCMHYGPDAFRIVSTQPDDPEISEVLRRLPQMLAMICGPECEHDLIAEQLLDLMKKIESEIERRKFQLSLTKSSNVDEHNSTVAQMGRKARKLGKVLSHKNKEQVQLLNRCRYLPRLFFVFNRYEQLREAAALCAEHLKFDLDRSMGDFLRISHGLGLHYLIVTDQEESAINAEIRRNISTELELIPSEPDELTYGCPLRGVLKSRKKGNKQVWIADVQANVSYQPVAPFRVALASMVGQYRVFFDSDTYCPSVDANQEEVTFEELKAKYENRPPKLWKKYRNADRRPDMIGNDEQGYGSTTSAKKTCDRVGSPKTGMPDWMLGYIEDNGISQAQLVAEVLKECAERIKRENGIVS